MCYYLKYKIFIVMHSEQQFVTVKGKGIKQRRKKIKVINKVCMCNTLAR